MKYIFLITFSTFLVSCGSDNNTDQYNNNRTKTNTHHSGNSQDCGEYKGHKLYRGEKGGCYYNHHNRKEYVDHSYCNCM